MPILVMGHIIFGATLIWSYINQQVRFLVPRRGGARQMVQNKSAEEIPQQIQAQNCTLYEILCLNLCVFTPLCRFAAMRLCL